MVLGYKPFLASVSLLPLFSHLSIIHSLFRLHLDFETELPLQPLCELHFYILILFQWSVFSCGHCICCQCAWVLLRQAGVGPRHRNVHVKCPMCRIPTIAQEISYVSTARTQKEESEENISVKVSVKNTFTLLNSVHFFVRFSVTWACHSFSCILHLKWALKYFALSCVCVFLRFNTFVSVFSICGY